MFHRVFAVFQILTVTRINAGKIPKGYQNQEVLTHEIPRLKSSLCHKHQKAFSQSSFYWQKGLRVAVTQVTWSVVLRDCFRAKRKHARLHHDNESRKKLVLTYKLVPVTDEWASWRWRHESRRGQHHYSVRWPHCTFVPLADPLAVRGNTQQ